VTEPLLLETVTRTALLGIRFWDRVSGRVVADGLNVTETKTGMRTAPNRSGVFVLHDFSGLQQSAFGGGGEAFWHSPPVKATATFNVVDTERRFLSYSFSADLPARGLFVEDCGLGPSPPGSLVGSMPLFSAPNRPVPAGSAVVRADLWDAAADTPAAAAVLELSANGAPVYRGVADALGRTVVLFPYPEPPWHGGSPPPGSHSLSEQTWPLTLAVRYAAGAAPDLCAVLTQPFGTLLASESPVTALGPQTLAFGRELVLRTSGRSVLLVLPS
jgi:hypothetical protein